MIRRGAAYARRMMLRFLIALLLMLLAAPVSGATPEELRARLEGSAGEARVDLLNELSKAYWGVSAEQTITQAKAAQQLAIELGYKAGEATALRHEGIGYWYQSDYQTALDRVQRAQALFEAIGDERGVTGALSTIGTVYLNLERYDRAAETYRQALELAERGDDQNRIGIVLSNLGTTHLGLEQPAEALKYFERALKILEQQGSELDILTALGNIGGAHRRLQRYAEALAINEEIIRRAEAIDSKVRICDALTDTAQILMESGRGTEADAYLTRAVDTAKAAGLKGKEQEAELQLAALHEGRRDFAAALTHFKRHDELRGEVFSEENARALAELRSSFEADKRERDIAARELELQVERGRRNLLIALSVLVLLLALVNYVRFRAKRREAELLDRLSRTDALTGLSNRRAIRQLLEQLRATATPFSVALGDVDHFKQFNDTHGHEVGDQVLVAVARALESALRGGDAVARWGGEEFLLVFRTRPGEPALEAAERARAAVAAVQLQSGDQALRVTATFGLAAHAPNEDIDACVRRADEALYAGKQAGRNRVVDAR